MKRKPVGWKNDPYRHSLASRGVSTTLPYPRKFKGDPVGKIEHHLFLDLGEGWRERMGHKVSGEAAIKLQLAKQQIMGYWDAGDYETIHQLLKRVMNAPNLNESYTREWIKKNMDDGTLDEGIIRMVNAVYPNLADLSKTAIIYDFGGTLDGVYNLPKGWDYEEFNIEEGKEEDYYDKLPKLRSKTVRVVYYEALPETIEGLPKGYDYVTYFDG